MNVLAKIPIIMTAKIEKNISISRPYENELEIFCRKKGHGV